MGLLNQLFNIPTDQQLALDEQRKYDAEMQRQQAEQVQGLLGHAPYEQPTPYQNAGEQMPGSGLMATMTDPNRIAAAKFYGGLMQVPGMAQQGAAGISQMFGDKYSSNKPMKPTSLMQNIEAIGHKPGTPEYQQALMGILQKPDTVINQGNKYIPINDLMKMRDAQGKMPPIGTTFDDAAEKGITLKQPISGENAGKKAMLDAGVQGANTIKNIMFNKDGSFNNDAINGAWGINVAEPVAGLVSPQAGQLHQAYEVGIQGITRLETGAAMQASELDNTRKRFMPKPWDSKEVKLQKWKAYNLFLNNASKYLDPKAARSGKAIIDFTTLMNDAKKQSEVPPVPGGAK